MKIIEQKNIGIKNSNSELGFDTTGGTHWEVWDRFLTYKNKPLFHIGNICGTCNFFFNKKEIKIDNKFTSKQISTLLNKGIVNLKESEINGISKIIPNGNYEVLITEIQPKISFPNDRNDYFVTDLFESWNKEYAIDSEANIPYYRGLSKLIKGNEKLFEFFIPIFHTNSLNEKRVKEYEQMLLNGEKPTALCLGILDVKMSMVYPEINGEEVTPYTTTHWCFANYIIDGHHKMMAANNLQKPITLITFISKDQSWKLVDEMIIELKNEPEK